jgi:hypothetical protein
LGRLNEPLPGSIDEVLALDAEVRRNTRDRLTVDAH